MNVLKLTSDHAGNKVLLRQDLIIALEDIENSCGRSVNRTRLHLKGGAIKDVHERIDEIREMFVS